jgi:hypothetical protein
MTIKFSLLSKFKSIIGFTIEQNGKIIRTDETPSFQRTVDISLGLLFGYVTIEFPLGKAHSIMDMVKEFGTEVFDKETDKNEWS